MPNELCVGVFRARNLAVKDKATGEVTKHDYTVTKDECNRPGTTLAIPSFIGGIINLVNTSRSMHDLNKTTLALVVVLAINAVATTIRGTLFTLAGERVVARLRK